MTKPLKTAAALALAFAVSACGAGSGDKSANQPTTTPPKPNKPTKPISPSVVAPTASSTTAEMISFAEDGGKTRRIRRTYRAGTRLGNLTQTTREVIVNGERVKVIVDKTGEGVAGIVKLVRDGQHVYRVNEDAPVVGDAADAEYTGQAHATYRLDGSAQLVEGQGDITLSLDTMSGNVAYGAVVNGSDNSSVEVYGDAEYKDGRFEDLDRSAILRVNDHVIRREDLDLSGVIVGSREVNAMVGKISGENATTGFVFDGIYMAGSYPD